jgi:hypothetical protein
MLPCLCPSSARLPRTSSAAGSSYRSPCVFLVPQHDQELASTTYIRSHGRNSLSRLPSPPPRFTAVPPPPVDPDHHITPSKLPASPLVLPGRFPLAAGDSRHRNLAGMSRLPSPMSQGPNCFDLNLSEGLTARFQSLPPNSKLVIFRNL